ncbi:MAG: response regulator [Acidobacteria bacterium]|nr:response regulator [Acidobacteriota bacterium]
MAEKVPQAAPRIWLLEDQPDHAELIRESIAARLPGAPVGPPEAGDGARPPDVVVASMAFAPGQVADILAAVARGGVAPPLLLVAGPGAEWPPEARDQLGAVDLLDKREGLAFLDRLPESVRGAVAKLAPQPAPERVPQPAPADPGLRVAADLAGSLEALLAELVPFVRIVAGAAGPEAGTRAFLRGIEHELGRARGMAERLALLLAGSSGGTRRRFVGAQHLLALRSPAWQRWLAEGVALELSLCEAPPEIEVDDRLLGSALDELLLEIARGLGPRDRVLAALDVVVLDEEFARERPGACRGRHARFHLGARGAPLPTSRVSGAGLRRWPAVQRGLAVAKAHGGYLEVRCDPAAGWLREADLFIGCAERRAGPESSATRQRVLVVDDEPAVRDTTRRLLESGGYETIVVDGGRAALDLFLAGCRYDLVLLDLGMEGIDGAALFRELRALDPEARVLVVSGDAEPTRLRQLLGEGALGFLPKPFGRAALLESVRAGLS